MSPKIAALAEITLHLLFLGFFTFLAVGGLMHGEPVIAVFSGIGMLMAAINAAEVAEAARDA